MNLHKGIGVTLDYIMKTIVEILGCRGRRLTFFSGRKGENSQYAVGESQEKLHFIPGTATD